MLCKACNRVPNTKDKEDCFEQALDILKYHYKFYKNAMQERDLELQRVKERNEKLNKALHLLQTSQQQYLAPPPNKRFKTSQQQQHIDDSWLGSNCDHIISDSSLTDDEPTGASNLNVALNSEQLFDTSASSPATSEINITSSSEFVPSPRVKESPKRNKQRDNMRHLRDCVNKKPERSKSEWHTKEHNSPSEKSWATKFLKPSNNENKTLEKNADLKKIDNRLRLSLNKSNSSKMKQSLIHFNKTTKDESIRESNNGAEYIVKGSPMISTKNIKCARSWAHRSGHNTNFNNLTSNINNIGALANVTTAKVDSDKTLEDIVFDFSPTKRTTDSSQKPNLINDKTKAKELKFDDDISTDCTALPNEQQLALTNNKPDSSSVMILTPNTQDIIFLDDSYNEDGDIDTMDLMADILKKGGVNNLENLKKYESKRLQKQQNKELVSFKKPQSAIKIKQENISQDLQMQPKDVNKDKPSVSGNLTNNNKPLNPLLSTENQEDEDDEDLMPKPFIIKQDPDISKCKEKLSIKDRFNIDCVECESLISFLDEGLTDEQIKEHLDKCKVHNIDILRQNTPENFWNPFILSFQADDPRNEVLIDTRFKDKTN